MTLAEDVLRGSPHAVARLISLVENRPADAVAVLRKLHPHTGRAYVVGVTGPPGAGKSTLIAALVGTIRRDGRRVGVVAVDPTSPFTGGAVLGDRIRMQDHSTDPGVFVRSMATRGYLGGLAPATAGVVDVLDASGCDLVLVETVGTGQAEVDVVRLADTVVVVTVPHLGDGVQTLKAGVMEIADLFVVNKADRGGADRTATEIKTMLGLAPDRQSWRPPVLLSTATDGTGVAEILAEIARHREHQTAHGLLDRRRLARRREEILMVAESRLRRRILGAIGADRLDALASRVARGETDLYTAADTLLRGAGIR
ncbi:MAG TPA: methylmalonyl Co-A mutase-associated GTPase MeaB [bacterium]|nr:methylmalonyl Co-A mutase-associated GTPase MeaB [bacterium]